MTENRKKIFVISQDAVVLHKGGAIKSFYGLIDILTANNFDVVGVYHLKNTDIPMEQTLHNGAKLINLASVETIPTCQQLFFKFRLLVEREKPDLMIFFFPSHLADFMGDNIFDNIPVMLRYCARPDYYHYVPTTSPEFKALMFEAVKRVDCVQILMESFREMAKKLTNAPVVEINNPVPIPSKFVDLTVEKKKIIYLTRLEAVKGVEFLIKSFAEIAHKYPDWKLDLAGHIFPNEKVLRARYMGLIKKYHLGEQVSLIGLIDNPLEKYLEYDFYVCPSYMEGFPNGLAEALSVGLPACGFKLASGVSELIVDKYNGFLCAENTKDFANKMEMLIKDKNLRIKMGKNSLKEMEKYRPEIISEKYINLVTKLINHEKINENPQKRNIRFFPINKVYDIICGKKKNLFQKMQTGLKALLLFPFYTYKIYKKLCMK